MLQVTYSYELCRDIVSKGQKQEDIIVYTDFSQKRVLKMYGAAHCPFFAADTLTLSAIKC